MSKKDVKRKVFDICKLHDKVIMIKLGIPFL